MYAQSLRPVSLQPHGLYPDRLLCPWDSSGKNTGVGCHFLLPGICVPFQKKLSKRIQFISVLDLNKFIF